jgi:hypothetical protein
MKFIHRFNLHYAPPQLWSPKYGERDHWCTWCGLRGKTWTFDPKSSFEYLPVDKIPSSANLGHKFLLKDGCPECGADLEVVIEVAECCTKCDYKMMGG